MELIRLLDKLNTDVGFSIQFSRNTSAYTNNNVFRVGTKPQPTEMADSSDGNILEGRRLDATKTSNPSNTTLLTTDDQFIYYITPITVFNKQRQTKQHISWIPTNHETEKRTVVRKVPKNRYVNHCSAPSTKQSRLVSKNNMQSNQYKRVNNESSHRVNYTSGSHDNDVVNNDSQSSNPNEIEIATDEYRPTFMEKPSSSSPIHFKLPNRLNNNKIQSMEYSHRTRLNIQPENII